MAHTPKPEGITALEEVFGPVIHAYTRADMLADGSLVDVSERAREFGFPHPVAVTRACYDTCIEWTEADAKRSRAMQNVSGRLTDVCWMAWLRLLGLRGRIATVWAPGLTLRYRIRVRPRPGHGRKLDRILKMVLCVGDDGTPLLDDRDGRRGSVVTDDQHWMDGGETACGLAIRTVRHFTAFWCCVTCPGCYAELERRRRGLALAKDTVDPARVFDAHGKTTVERFDDLLLSLQSERRAS